MRTRRRSIQLLELREELLLKIIAYMTTTEGRGLLLCCRRLSDLARPSVFPKRQKEVRINLFFWELWICDNSGPCSNLGPATALSQAAGLVVSASTDRNLRVWRLADGACLRTLSGHTDGVLAVVDVGGGRVASGGDDCVLHVWVPAQALALKAGAPQNEDPPASSHPVGEIHRPHSPPTESSAAQSASLSSTPQSWRLLPERPAVVELSPGSAFRLAGMVPVSPFWRRSRYASAVALPSSGGMVPLRELARSDSACRLSWPEYWPAAPAAACR